MSIFLFENITYTSKLPKDEVIARLKNYVDTDKIFSIKKNYEGEITGRHFEIKRVPGINLRFPMPRFIGEIQQEDSETTIHIKVRPNIFEFLLLAVIFLIFITYSIVQQLFFPFGITALALILIFLIIVLTNFKIESLKSKEDFAKIFRGKIISNSNID